MAIRDKNLIECSRGEVEELFKMVMAKIGIRANNLPIKDEITLLYNHLVRYYGGMTASEFILAFDLAITGKLAGFLEKDQSIKCFESFDCLYLSGILNAYKKWANQAYADLRSVLPNAEQRIYTDEEILNQRREEIENAFQAMKNGYFPILHTYFVQVLKEDGLLQEVETIAEFFSRRLATTQNVYKKDESTGS